MSPLSKIVDRLLDDVNPAFALTVRMRACHRTFWTTAFFSGVAAALILVASTTSYPASMGFSESDFFEIVFLVTTACSIVFLGCDFGSVFIESTFKDELFRSTPMTPLQIVHGGIASSLFFSFGLWCWTLPFIGLASFQFPVHRVFCGTLVLFVAGQTLNLVLLSYYIKAKSWKDIGPGAATAFGIILLFAAFGATEFGHGLFVPETWADPMTFLFVVLFLTILIAYGLARNQARSPKRSFRRTVLVNACVYVPFFILVSFGAAFLPRFFR